MTDDATGATDAGLANKARNRDRVKRWQQRQQAKGRCRCGLRIAPGSRSRCLECLERRRLDQRRRRGIHTTRRRPRGRPVIGPMRARRQAFLDEEARRERARKRRLGLPVCPKSGRKRKREIQRVIKGSAAAASAHPVALGR